MLQAALARVGFVVETATNGAELLTCLDIARVTNRIPQLIISDVCMPGLTGLDVLNRVRRLSPGIPIILITAFGDTLTHQRARALGAADVLDKPFALGLLCRRVQMILDGPALSCS